MILALNLRRLLSGSRMLAFFAVCIILLSLVSCSEKVTRPGNRPSPGKVTPEKNPPKDALKLDTLQFSEVPDEVANPIESPAFVSMRELSVKKNSYKIALIVPFRANQLQNADYISGSYRRFIEFYAGVQMAAKQLESEGVNLEIKVYDSKYDDEVVESLLKHDKFIEECDLIIGPYKRTALESVIRYAQESKKTILSPWISSNNLTYDNPYYVQLKPSIKRHYQFIYQHLRQKSLADKAVLVLKAGDKGKMAELQDIFVGPIGDELILAKFKDTLYIPGDSLGLEVTAFGKMLQSKDRLVFFVPYHSSQDESFVYNALRKLNIERGTKEVYVYGPGTWLNFKDEILDLFQPLNIRVSVSNFFDPTQQNIRELQKKYFEKYGSLLSQDVAEGFDVMYFTGKALTEFGNYFQAFGDEMNVTLYQTGFQLRPVTAANMRSVYGIDFFENFYVQIMGYKDYQYIQIP
jgi:hypothetical protein